ncbi:hypothetical protein C8J57DRAFT_1731106 [Mycena rebaudengoi]|nr:hypothetical protein C8J57DRAFT_1731106 [Mycena rebaudengoi]
MDTQSCIKDGVSDIDEGPRSSAQSTPAGPRGKMWYMARPPHAHAYVSTSPCACPSSFDRRAPCPSLKHLVLRPFKSHPPSPPRPPPHPLRPPCARGPSPTRSPARPPPLGRRVPPFLRTSLG